VKSIEIPPIIATIDRAKEGLMRFPVTEIQEKVLKKIKQMFPVAIKVIKKFLVIHDKATRRTMIEMRMDFLTDFVRLLSRFDLVQAHSYSEAVYLQLRRSLGTEYLNSLSRFSNEV
jgi:hypothetical protein